MDHPTHSSTYQSLLSADWLLDTMPWGILVVDEQHIVRRVNQQAARWGDVVPAALLGQPVTEAPLPPGVRAALAQLLASTSPGPIEVVLLASERWITCDATRQPGGWVVYGQDITPQKQREQQYQALAENTPDVLTRWTPDLRLRYANAALAAKVGAPLAALLHKTKREMGLPEAVTGPYMAALQRVFDTGQPQELYHSLPTPQGNVAYHSRLVPELRDGQIETVLGIAHDLTELHQTQAEALRLRDALTQQATDKYHALFQRMNQGFCVLEIQFNTAEQQAVGVNPLEVNPRFAQELGMAAYATGDILRELVPALDDFWLAAFGQVVCTGEAQHLERYEPQVSRWFEVHIFQIGPPAAHQVAVLFSDISARKQAEQRQQYVMQLADALRPLADPLAIQREALAVLRAHLGGTRTLYAEALDQEGTMYISTEDRDPGLVPMEGLVMRFQDFTPDGLAEAKAGHPLWRSDVLNEAYTPEQQAGNAAFGTRAWLMVPLVKNGCLVADLTVHSATARTWTAHDIALVQETTERTWAAVERAKAEEALRASEATLAAVFDVLPVGIGLTDTHGRLTLANHQMRRYLPTGIMPSRDETHQQQRWYAERPDGSPLPPTEFPGARAQRGEKVVPGIEMLHTPAEGPPLWTQVFAVPLQYRHDQVVGHVTVILDIDAHKRAERQQAFLLKLSDALRPLTSPADVQATAAALLGEHLGVDRAYYVDLNYDTQEFSVVHDWHRPGTPSYARRYPFGDWPMPWVLNGQTWVCRDVDTDPTLPDAQRADYRGNDIRAAVVVPLLEQGRLAATLVVSQNVPHAWSAQQVALVEETAARIWTAVERARAEEALAASEQRMRALITNLPGAAAFVVGPDLRYQLAGGEALDAAGLGHADLLGRTVAEAMPPELVPQYETYYRQALAGQDFSLEHTAHGRTFVSRGVPLLGAAGQPEAVLVVSYDITARKQAEEALRASEAQLAELNAQLEQRVTRRTQQLQASRDLLQSVFDTSLISMSVFHAVRDEAGQVLDFRLDLVNKKLEHKTGRTDLVGKRYAQEYPGIRQVGIFDLMLRALATNEPQGMEYFYDHEGFNGWYSCQFVKMGDGVVATNLDITERKLAEQERLKNLRLLEQAEAVAGLGSWDYDLATGCMRWSDGMYHLVGLPLGQPVSPEVYLQFVVDDDRPHAEQLVRQLNSGQSVEQTLRLRVGEHLKTVRLKAVVLRDETGQAARILGVDLDISELQRLEADNLRLRLGQQQALFEAVQEAQEEERRRMSENLHNGIGQILYATKLQLDRLPDAPELSPRHRAAELLHEAIRQTRALSHELTPATLEEFGLEATLRGMCRMLNTPALQWHCHFDFEESPLLAMPLQLALYRLAQELVQNVLKHAQATEATLEVEILPDWAVLRVEDNGRGFDLATSSDGLGLRTLRGRVALLRGSLRLTSTLGQGTQCQILLPLTPTLA